MHSECYLFLRYICSMRWETMKPPKMLIEARVTASKPITWEKFISAGPAAIKAPTMITD